MEQWLYREIGCYYGPRVCDCLGEAMADSHVHYLVTAKLSMSNISKGVTARTALVLSGS